MQVDFARGVIDAIEGFGAGPANDAADELAPVAPASIGPFVSRRVVNKTQAR